MGITIEELEKQKYKFHYTRINNLWDLLKKTTYVIIFLQGVKYEY